MPVLDYKNISMRYHTLDGETLAIDGFSHSFEKGEFTAIVGPSGCGKSTILSLAAGLIFPDSGQVLLNGEEVKGPSAKVGYMLQSDHLFPWLTIEKNACVGLKVRHLLNPDTLKNVRDLLESCGLADFMDKYPYQLSGGMRQRAALVRTLALDPDILLLDEPFSALDYQTRLNVSQDVHRIIREKGKTAVLVTHDITEAISMADRVIVLSKRPARVLFVHDIELTGSPMERRMSGLINRYFDMLWRELNMDE